MGAASLVKVTSVTPPSSQKLKLPVTVMFGVVGNASTVIASVVKVRVQLVVALVALTSIEVTVAATPLVVMFHAAPVPGTLALNALDAWSNTW